MDVGELKRELEELKKFNESWDLYAVGKGKKGAKTYKGGGKGEQTCYNCYEKGHIAANCSKSPHVR